MKRLGLSNCGDAISILWIVLPLRYRPIIDGRVVHIEDPHGERFLQVAQSDIFRRTRMRAGGALYSKGMSTTSSLSSKLKVRVGQYPNIIHGSTHSHATKSIHHSLFSRTSALSTRYSTNVPAIKLSPNAQIPADQTSNREVIQKKLIDCPISSHDPLSVTWKKKVIVMPAPDRFSQLSAI